MVGLTAGIQFQAPPVRSSATLRRTSVAFETSRYTTALFPSSGSPRFVVYASKSPNEDSSMSQDNEHKQDDLSYLLKLGGGSIIGAAAIKYGSILVPEITRPNIIQALVMIFTPVLVSVLILIKESSVER